MIARASGRCAARPAGRGRRTRGRPGTGPARRRTPSRGRTPPRRGGSRRSGPPTPAPARRPPRRAAPRRRAASCGCRPADPAARQCCVVRVVGGDPGDELLEVRTHQLDALVDRRAPPAGRRTPARPRDRSSRGQGGSSAGTSAGAATIPAAVTRSGMPRRAGQGVRAAHRHAEHGEPVDAEQVGDGDGVVRDRQVAGRGGVGEAVPGPADGDQAYAEPAGRVVPGTSGEPGVGAPVEEQHGRPGGGAALPEVGPPAVRQPRPPRGRSCGRQPEPLVAVADHRDRDQAGDDLGDAGADPAEQPPATRPPATSRGRAGSRSRGRRRPSGSARPGRRG